MIYHFQELSSTNDQATQPSYHEGDVIWAERQSAGRGQRGHSWESEEGKNLTFSVLLEPTFLAPQDQFMLLRVIALSMVDTLLRFGIEARIKWTNDIYVGDKKIVGILMEHKLQGSELSRAIAGIGINVNQQEFSPKLPNPTSMALLKGKEFDREQVLQVFLESLMTRYDMLRQNQPERLIADYNSLLYRLNEWHTYALPDGELFEGRILGVEQQGALRIERKDGSECQFLFKEVEFVLNN
ncbi:MAG: biotin--[Alistipes sp.]|nr:biotin--[acetyl-CoA-carboxylase] ligase [Alistipes sp.]